MTFQERNTAEKAFIGHEEFVRSAKNTVILQHRCIIWRERDDFNTYEIQTTSDRLASAIKRRLMTIHRLRPRSSRRKI